VIAHRPAMAMPRTLAPETSRRPCPPTYAAGATTYTALHEHAGVRDANRFRTRKRDADVCLRHSPLTPEWNG
jgi:hypothetical protein